MIAETLSLDFVGNAAGLQDAVMASQRALMALNRDTSRFSFSIGRVMRTIVTPIASIILSAFAAKKALADFTQSGLPGVAQFNQTLGLMRLSMFRLSSAVGELLAPAAERAARIVTAIADRLEPMIRRLTAAIPAMATFLRGFGVNLLAAVRPLMPTVFGIIDGILDRLRGADWNQVLANLVKFWQQSWTAIINFTAPIIIRIATLLDTVVRVGREALGSLFAWLSQKAADLGITLPNTIRAINSFTEAMQAAIIVVISALEVAVENIPLLFRLATVAAKTTLDFISANWRNFGTFLLNTFSTALSNLGIMLANFGGQMLPVFEALGENLAEILGNSLSVAIQNAFNMAQRQLAMWYMPDQVKNNPAARAAFMTALELNFPTDLKPTFDLKPIPGVDLSQILVGTQGMPLFKTVAADMKELNDVLEQVNKTFGTGIAKRVKDALLQGPQLVANLLNGLVPGFFGQAVPPRLDRFEPIGALLFGSREAAARESNQLSKNPLVPLAQQQNNLTAEQLVVLRAQQRALERKARIANF